MNARSLAPLIAVACCVSSQAVAIDSKLDRAIHWSDGIVNATALPLVVTASNFPIGGDRLADPNNPASTSGFDLTGVGRLFLDIDSTPGSGALCSGSLLEGGQAVLTAAHCVTDAAGDLALIDGIDGNSITFQTAFGQIVAPFTADAVTVHPNYNGDVRDGFDVAVIDLGAALSTDVARYELNDGSVNEANVHFAAGFGQSGDGGTGATIGAGQLRSGFNNHLVTGLPVGGINNLQTQLTADFDSGSPAEDAFGVFDEALFGVPIDDPFEGGLGFGSDEIGIAPGDSGGPTFLQGPDGLVISGVHSYGLRLELLNGDTSDLDDELNSSFGEFYVDARVADPEVLGFIRSAAIPEPASAWLAGAMAMVFLGKVPRSK